MAEYRSLMDINRARWNEMVPIHRDSAFYDLDGFRRGRTTVDDVAMGLLGDVAGKTLLHLQCHFGMDTLSLARLGARVTGVDYSDQAIVLARSLAEEIDVEARFIEANIYDVPDVLDEEFEIVFTSHGTITWLPDIEGWARVVAGALRPGGRFVFLDGHPLAGLNQEKVDGYEFQFSYFSAGQTFAFDEDGTYADPTAKLANRETREWHHQLDEIVNALIGAGLAIERLGEYPQLAWRMLPFMERGDDGWWRVPPGRPQLPMMLSIVAVKPS
jgi:SAM-dependent methyltransferase